MKSNKVIIKFHSVCEQDQYLIKRISGVIGVDSFIKLIDIAHMDANPRKPKVSAVTAAIQDSLETDPSIFQFKTKGILLSCYDCKTLDRKRYQLTFDDPDIEGILDGGHNTLAISMYLLKLIAPDDKEVKSIKNWDDLEKVWAKYRSELEEFFLESPTEHLIPLEILSSSNQDFDKFASEILDISEARNNNAELTIETKNNKAGYYDRLKEHIDPELRNKVEWKANDGGRIKVRDLIALSMIPISLISEKIGKPSISPVQIFSSKGACVKYFGDIFREASETIKGKGSIRQLNNKSLDSALSLMKDIPRLYDLIDLNIGDAYNDGNRRYGGLEHIKFYEAGKYKKGEKNSKYLIRPPVTKFYEEDGKYKSPEAYFIPIVVALRALMKVDDDGIVSWAVDDPEDFIKRNLKEVMSSYRPLILALKDPAQVGKASLSYHTAENAFKLVMK